MPGLSQGHRLLGNIKYLRISPANLDSSWKNMQEQNEHVYSYISSQLLTEDVVIFIKQKYSVCFTAKDLPKYLNVNY